MAIRVVIAAMVAAAICWTIYAADQPSARYTRNMSCHYNVIFRQTGAVDIVTIGSSRALRAISGPHGGTLLGDHLGRPALWLDLSRSWRGRGQIYRQVVDILENRDVEHLLIEYFPDSRYYGRYAKTATAVDLIEDPFISQQGSLYERIAFSLKTAGQKYARFLTAQIYEPQGLIVRPEKESESVDCITGESPLKKSKLAQRLDAYPVPEQVPQGDWDFDSAAEARNSGYIDKIISAATAHGVNIAFFKTPLLNEGPLSENMQQQFRARFGADIHVMDYAQRNTLFGLPDNYGDATHMRKNGREFYTEWLMHKVYPGAGS